MRRPLRAAAVRSIGPALVAILCALLLVAVAAPSAAAEARTALVVGNAAYGFAPLANPLNDATDIAAALRGAGFEVTLATDADQPTLKAAVRRFADTLKSRGGVGLFFFAGHGVQVGGENYIVPISPRAPSAEELRTASVTASEVVDAMTSAGNVLNIVVLDACRDNPIAGTSTRGLSRIDSGASLFVSFSTSPGAVALDGSGRNSPYAKHLTQALATPGLTLEDTFKRTLKGVYQETRGQQTPWLSSSFFGDFVFREAALAPRPMPSPAPAPPSSSSPPPVADPRVAPREPRPVQAAVAPRLAGLYRADGKNPDGSRYRGMVALQPAGEGMRFTWWIGRDVFRGTGEFAGRMLVVNWGQTHPVIYGFGGSRDLDGEWADGTATERLTLFAAAADRPVAPPQGRYRVAGRNADGSRYAGTLAMRREGDLYRLSWRVGSSGYQGTGRLDSNVLTVDWGAATPVVYALAADGTLTGLWDAGRGEEILTPE
ncbi:MAG: caspase family protein [Rhodoplanes sp.]|uniref:caspase family protein n=1 Tax=Rhodoplanes sp. TaxID=1968906 RepID=UPI0017F9C4C3|nr:caspase family protein [Rhodoplanes sp.]NVO16907.1 caspase family protein [Rhodoplanes sp.]